MPVPVGPGRTRTVESPRVSHDEGVEAAGYPIQPSKAQRPPLRDETLARERLLDWFAAKIHHRVIYVIAEAGYGKTTLLADFSRRTRIRTLWYRLDRDDRDWVAFLSYLVAAGREFDPSFGATTAALLGQIGPAGPTREAVTQSLIRDLAAFGADGAAVIFDDYHAVDDSADVRFVVEELLAHAPERMSFVISSRRPTGIRVARLRALGEVAELSTDDLRFNEPETEQLFRETYGHPLEPDVLGDLSSRTEGWAASLQLVEAAIRERSTGEVRRFVRSLSGAEGDLYDYLAEEVVGDLPVDLQDFLMKASVLETIDQPLAATAAEVDAGAAAGYLAAAERIGVLGRRGRGSDSTRGFHPLVRDFLRARFARDAGADSIAATHLRIAKQVEDSNWELACHHYGAGNRPEDVHRLLRTAIREIMGSGQFGLATGYLDRHPPPSTAPEFEAIRSRAEFASGRRQEALSRAERAAASCPESDIALLNLLAIQVAIGDLRRLDELTAAIGDRSDDPLIRAIATATSAVLRLSVDGSLAEFVAHAVEMAEVQKNLGLGHYQGISLLNAAAAMKAQGEADACLIASSRAIELLAINSASHEVAAARALRIWALAHVGRWDDASSEIGDVVPALDALSKAEALTELGVVHLWYGDNEMAVTLLEAARPWMDQRRDMLDSWRAAAVEQAVRARDLDRAHEISQGVRSGELNTEPAFTAHWLAVSAYLAVVADRPEAAAMVNSARQLADRQDARFWSRYAQVLAAAISGQDAFSPRARSAVEGNPVYLSILAEVIVNRLSDADDVLVRMISDESRLRPVRWRSALRSVVDEGTSMGKWRAGHLLDEIGEPEDVARLRSLAKSAGRNPLDRMLGKRLARHLAPTIYVEDCGRVSVRVGGNTIHGSFVRRKVLALLCFLISRRGFSATRDQVLDALWPELEPTVALNSLNQTVYFLRRVFDVDYDEDLSAGYVRHDSNVLWLDGELVGSRTTASWELLRRAGTSWSPTDVEALASTYSARFALDFAYEDWAMAYRDSLHAAYLQVMETAIARDTSAGSYDRAISLARRALGVDPDAEQIEVSLLRLYQLSGAHSAAAEQYAHYADAVRRELGVEPPGLEML